MKNYETGIQKLIREKKTSKDVKEQKEMAMEGRAIAMALKSKDKK